MCMNFAYLTELFFKKYEPTLFYAWLYKMNLQRNIYILKKNMATILDTRN